MTLLSVERIKLFSTKSPYWCLASVFAAALLFALLFGTLDGAQNATTFLSQTGLQIGTTVFMVMAALAVTTEYRFGNDPGVVPGRTQAGLRVDRQDPGADRSRRCRGCGVVVRGLLPDQGAGRESDTDPADAVQRRRLADGARLRGVVPDRRGDRHRGRVDDPSVCGSDRPAAGLAVAGGEPGPADPQGRDQPPQLAAVPGGGAIRRPSAGHRSQRPAAHPGNAPTAIQGLLVFAATALWCSG